MARKAISRKNAQKAQIEIRKSNDYKRRMSDTTHPVTGAIKFCSRFRVFRRLKVFAPFEPFCG
jgi:hypothetical protein